MRIDGKPGVDPSDVGGPAALPAYSYRRDAGVPSFADDAPLIVFDGVCVLCSGFARFVARHDAQRTYRFTAAQSLLGAALFRHYGLQSVNYETSLLIVDGRAYGKLVAVSSILSGLGGIWRLCGSALRLVPTRLGEWLYDAVARNRYRMFGRHAVCLVADADWRSRVID